MTNENQIYNNNHVEATEEDPLRQNNLSEEKEELTFREKVHSFFANITVEPHLLLFIVANMIIIGTSQNLYLDKACRVSLNYTQEICDSLRAQDVESQNEYERESQKIYAKALTWKTYLSATLPSILALFAGAFSDKTGHRKIFMIIPTIGMTLLSINNIVNVYFYYQLSLEVLVFTEGIIEGLSGGWCLSFMTAFAYISTITTDKDRTYRMGLMSFSMTVAFPIGTSTSGVLLRNFGFYGCYGLTAVLHVINLLYVIFVIKDPKRNKDQKKDSSLSATVYPGCSGALRTAFAARGTPDPALDLILSSLSTNTLQQYNGTYKLWWYFCNINNIRPYVGSLPSIMLFLTEQFNKGAAYGSLNSHRSALSLLLGSHIVSDDLVKRLLKGVYKLRPATPKYSYTWDPQVVLNFIGNWFPNRTLSIKKITLKLVTLLALCTAHRVQTLALIKLENIRVGSTGIQIGISEVIKTSASGREQPVLYLPYFNENKSICPATIILDYMFVTKNVRPQSTHNLILTHRQPHKPATAQSISRWIKQVLGASGVDLSTFSAHSTRYAATSAARASGLSVDAIRKAAGWTSTSLDFARFYHRQIIN